MLVPIPPGRSSVQSIFNKKGNEKGYPKLLFHHVEISLVLRSLHANSGRQNNTDYRSNVEKFKTVYTQDNLI